MPFLPNSKIYLEHCPRGEALITSHMRFSSNEVASHVKQLPFRPLLLIICTWVFVKKMFKLCLVLSQPRTGVICASWNSGFSLVQMNGIPMQATTYHMYPHPIVFVTDVDVFEKL